MTNLEHKPVAVKRKIPGDELPKIPSMAQRKRPSCLLVILLILLALSIIIVLLTHFEVIKFPEVTQPSIEPTNTELPNTETQQMPTTKATLTPTLSPTYTKTATPTKTATLTLTPTATERLMPYVVRGVPERYPSSMLFQSIGCSNLLIGGQVWDLTDAPVSGLVVRLGGYYGDLMIDEDSVTGSVPAYDNESGYGFILNNQLIVETRLYLQLEDSEGNPLSNPIFLETSDLCSENLILVNFKQVR